jgi:surface polysaccharide O-acyltransferase-like enzyme
MKKNKIAHTNYGITLLRIICTLCVIIIHVSAPMVMKFGKIPDFDWHVANFYDSISRFSVPVFFMISGSLLLGREFEIKDFLKNRLGKIIPPFLFWSLFYTVTARYFFGNEAFNISKITRDVFYGSKYHLWFVFALIGVYLIAPVFQKWIHYSKENDIKYFLIIWVITLFMTIPGVAIYFPKIDFSYFAGYLGYFVLGYYLKNHVTNRNLISYALIFIGLSITIFGSYYMTKKEGVFYYYFYEYLCINALMVSSGIFMLFNKIEKVSDKIKPFLAKLNDCSFGIYLIHPFILDSFFSFGVFDYTINSIVDILLISLACFFISLMVISLIKKIKFGHLIA